MAAKKKRPPEAAEEIAEKAPKSSKTDGAEKPSEKESAELLTQAKAHYKEADDIWAPIRKESLADAKFRSGEHWPEKVRKEREDAGRPTLKVDKTEQYLRQVVNDGRQNRPGPKISPLDSRGDDKVAEAFKGIVRSIFSRSSADQAFDTALDHAVGQGYGFFRIITQFEHARSFNQEILVKRVRNPLSVMLGPFYEADGSDAPYGFVIEDVRKETFKLQYPNAKAIDWNATGYQDGWSGEHTVRIAEYYYKTQEPGELLLLDDGTVVTVDEYERDMRQEKPAAEDELAAILEEHPDADFKPAIVSRREEQVTKVKWCRLTGCEVLERKEWAGTSIPILIVIGVERDVEGKLMLEGMLRPAKDAQRLYNFARSGFAEHVSLSTKTPWVAAEGQLEGYEDDWENSNTENIPVLTYKPKTTEDGSALLPPPSRPQGSGVPAGLAQDMELSQRDIQGAMGMYNASVGERSNEKSGRAITARQRESDTGTFHFHDNLNRAIRFAIRQIVEIAPKVMDNKRVVRLLGEDGKATLAMLDPKIKGAFEKRGDMMVYNIGAGLYDVDIDTGPSYTTKRQEAAEAMLELSRAVPELLKFAGDIMVRNMDWPGAEEIANRLKRMLPPELQDDGDEMSPEVKAVRAQAQQLIDRLTQQLDDAEQGMMARDQAMAEMKRECEELQMQLKNKAGETAIKAAGASTDQYEAETDRMVAVEPAMTPEAIAAIVAQTVREIMMQPVPSQPPPEPDSDDLEPAPAGFFTPEGA
jgi:hypothetical protein